MTQSLDTAPKLVTRTNRKTATCCDFSTALDAARARGLKRIGIGVLAGSDRVHRFYTTLGYRDYAISLRKELPP